MKNIKRSVRRHHYERLKKKWFDKLLDTWYWSPEDRDLDHVKKMSAKYTRTRCYCSTCYGCRNPRQFEGVTLQERRNLLSYTEQIKEV